MAVRPERIGTVDWYVDTIVRNKARYQRIEAATGVPWFWTGVTHGLEGAFDFNTHLHNGDSLSARTRQVPAGRPLTGTAPFSWETSAIDAITMKGYQTWKDWHKPSILAYAWERYNGFGYRNKGISSPYLWSMSYHYSRGKYTADGYYDPNAVSAQAGAMGILKRGVDRGLFSLVSQSGPPPAPASEIVKADAKPELKRTLYVGVAAGRDVLLLKMRLKSFGLFNGIPDERFDDAAAKSVQAAQRLHGLTADGAVGPMTWTKLWPSLSDAGWLKAWKRGDKIDVRAMAGDKCIFKVVSKEVPALTPFLKAMPNAKTVSFGGDAALAVLPNECPDLREAYDIGKSVVLAPSAATPAASGAGTAVTWHKLYRGPSDEWNVNSFNGGAIVTSLKTRVKADLVQFLETHTKAHMLVGASNDETPVR